MYAISSRKHNIGLLQLANMPNIWRNDGKNSWRFQGLVKQLKYSYFITHKQYIDEFSRKDF